MPRFAAILLAVGLVVAACTAGEADPPISPGDESAPPASPGQDATTTVPVPIITSSPSEPDPTLRLRPSVEAAGRLVVIDDAGDVVTMDPDGGNPTTIADASEEGATYYQPAWSPTSPRVAWSTTGGSSGALVTAAADGTGRRTIAMDAPPFYFHWAPDGSAIAALHNATAGVALASVGIELEIVDAERSESVLWAAGAPFYFSWSPDGADLAAHVRGFSFVSIGIDGSTTDLGETSTDYQAPHWLPGGILHVEGSSLVVEDGSGDSRPVASLPGPVTFVANPTGSRIAIQAIGPEPATIEIGFATLPDVPPNAVFVLDTETGDLSRASSTPSIGFFWSPDGTKLLILEPTSRPGEVDLTLWEDGETTRFATYMPSISFVQRVLPFFGQYAQSHRFWSPDSDWFAFVGKIGGTEGIWVQTLDGADPTFVSGGSWVAWSNE